MSEPRKRVSHTNRETCYFCGSDGPIESHHIIPQRYDGSDHDSNLVDLCPTCHERLERLYDEEFYAKIGAGTRSEQVEVILSAAAEEFDRMVEDLAWQVESLRGRYIDLDINDARENAVHELTDGEEDGELDVGTSQEQRDRLKHVRSTISAIESRNEDGAPIDTVINELIAAGLEQSEIDHELENLRQRGEVYEPVTDHLRTT